MIDSEKPSFELSIAPVARQNRWTVLFRGLMVIPHYFILMFLIVAAEVLTFFAWFAILFTGRNPFHEFVSNVIRWGTRVGAYNYLLTDAYPPFSLSGDAGYPVTTRLDAGPMSRLTVFFRIILSIPAGIVSAVLGIGMALVLIVGWFATLIRGTLPQSIHNAVGATIRYQTRVTAYSWLVQDSYPRGLFGERGNELSSRDAVDPLNSLENASLLQNVTDPSAPLVIETIPDAVTQTSVGAAAAHTPMSPLQIPSRSTNPWEIILAPSSRRVIVTELIAGSIGYIAIIVVYVVLIGSFVHSVAQGSIWSSNYRSDIVALQVSGTSAMNSIDPSAPNWSAIASACASTGATVSSYKAIPQYPIAGANKHLLEGFGLIALAANDCTTTIAPKHQVNQLPALKKVLRQGATQLQIFLAQS